MIVRRVMELQMLWCVGNFRYADMVNSYVFTRFMSPYIPEQIYLLKISFVMVQVSRSYSK